MPDDDDHAETDTEAGLVRAADLIGQLGDPLYPRKLNALYYEFAEIGVNQRLGYVSPADVAEQYPTFFWSKVEPYIGEAISHLELTMEGRQWIAQLYSNVFALEHHRQHMGPQVGASTELFPQPSKPKPTRDAGRRKHRPILAALIRIWRTSLDRLYCGSSTPRRASTARGGTSIMRHNRLRALLTADRAFSRHAPPVELADTGGARRRRRQL